MILLFLLVMVYHTLILTGIVPYAIAWGGRLKTREEMLVFETISLMVNALMLVVVFLKTGRLSWKIRPKTLNAVLWFMCVLFFLNTIGNIFAINKIEQLVFTPLTLLLSLLCLRLVRQGG